MRRERLFLALTLLLPVLLFAVAEGAARLIWRDAYPRLFLEAPVGNGAYLVANPRIAKRWFPMEQRPPAPSAELMRRVKTPGVFRVFVLGESAAQGFPYPRTGAFSRALAPLLQAATSDTVEVINLGIAATNSFSMLDILDEVLAQSPDAVVYYGGHNEYYGAFGAGSSVGVPGGAGLARVFLRMQRLRVLYVANHWLAALRRGSAGPAPADADISFMGSVARDRAIAINERVYLAGAAQYEQNLRRIARRVREAGVQLYVASVGSNERDQAPFASPENGAADSAYALAGEQLAAGDTAAARASYAAARDLDVIRFRAPSAFVSVAKAVASAENAVYVPTAEALADASPGGIPGASLFLEHVHPNRDGSWILARTVFAAMVESPPMGRAPSALPADSVERLRGRRGLTPFDDRVVTHKLAALTARWPFVPADSQDDYFGRYRAGNGADSLAFLVAAGALTWEQGKLARAEQLARAGEPDAAVAEYASVWIDSPQFPVPWQRGAELLARSGRLAEAESLLAEAVRRAPSVELFALRAQVATEDGRFADAAGHWETVAGYRPRNPEVLYRWSLAAALAGDSTVARGVAARLGRVGTRDPNHVAWIRLLSTTP